jgi:short-subunit dehydrogenase
MKQLANQIVLITGAGGSFGRELTKQFLRAGSHLILTDVHADALPCAANVLSDARGSVLGTISADLSTPEGCAALAAAVHTLTPHIDMLINNAGLGLSGVISDVPQARWERLMQVNLHAPMRLSAAFLPAMIGRRSGHIVSIASVAGLVGPPGLTAYSASKLGLRGFSESLHADVRQHNVDVSIVYPFYARTPILQSPQYGPRQARLPDWLLYEPEFVAAAVLDGVRRRKLHVYPGVIPHWIDLLNRLAPWLLPLVVRAPRGS